MDELALIMRCIKSYMAFFFFDRRSSSKRAGVNKWAPCIPETKSFLCRSAAQGHTVWKLSHLKLYNQRQERGGGRKLIRINSVTGLTDLMYSTCRFISSTRGINVLVVKLQSWARVGFIWELWSKVWSINLLTAARFQYIWNPFVHKALPHLCKTSAVRNILYHDNSWTCWHAIALNIHIIREIGYSWN